jgi:Uma2 family endonuclease
MATVETRPADLTAADIAARFGPIPLRRIVLDPSPGTATEEDVIAHLRRTGRACELIDGILVEKDVSWETSTIAAEIIRLIGNFVRDRLLGGKVAGEQGMTWLPVGRLRGPDVSYVSPARLPTDASRTPYPTLAPNLAVEVLSPGNTAKEMSEKLDDYFESGVELVWYVDPAKRTVRVYAARDKETVLAAGDLLDGGTVLPGFAVKVADLFDRPAADAPPKMP